MVETVFLEDNLQSFEEIDLQIRGGESTSQSAAGLRHTENGTVTVGGTRGCAGALVSDRSRGDATHTRGHHALERGEVDLGREGGGNEAEESEHGGLHCNVFGWCWEVVDCGSADCLLTCFSLSLPT